MGTDLPDSGSSSHCVPRISILGLIKPLACCRLLSALRSVSGHSITAATEVVVAKLSQPQRLYSRRYMRIDFDMLHITGCLKP